jgi:hypothetical protein
MTDLTHSYFVVMIDYGRIGLEANVTPEMTRRGAVEKVREALGDGNRIAFVHRITMNEIPEDVTDEMVRAAEFEENVTIISNILDGYADRLANAQDHARKLAREAV